MGYFHCGCQRADLYSASPVNSSNTFCKLLPCERNAPESSFGGVQVVNRVRETVPGGRTSNIKSLAVIPAESVSQWHVEVDFAWRNGNITQHLSFILGLEMLL